MDYSEIFPTLNGYLLKPLLVNPPLCTLKELKDGTYNLADLETMNQIIDLKNHMRVAAPPNPLEGIT